MSETALEAETAARDTETSLDAEIVAADAADVSPSVRVVEVVAEAADADPTTIDPLYDAVDPDALDRLVGAEFEGHVEFAYAGHDVTVHGDGAIVVASQEVR